MPRLVEASRVAAVALLACTVVAAAMLGIKGVEASDAAWITAKERLVSAVVADLDGRIAPGDFVQVLDTTEAGVHALLRLRAVQPTRFIYDFHFYHDVQTPMIRRLRDEFLTSFDAHPPKFVLLFERGWPAGGYERVDGFAGLRKRLLAYRVNRRGGGDLRVAPRQNPAPHLRLRLTDRARLLLGAGLDAARALPRRSRAVLL